jgi:hypothetical protein
MGLSNPPNSSPKRIRRASTITTSSIANNVTETNTIPLATSFVLQSVTVSTTARVRLYQTTAQLLTDANRASTVAPTGNHGLIFESIGSGLIPTQFSVVGANKESTPIADIPISITNQSGGSAIITVTANFTALED